MQTISLIKNINNKYINENNNFYKKLKREESKNNEVYLMTDEIILHNWKDRKLETSIFEYGLSKPDYFRMKKEHILRLINYLHENNLEFH